MGRCRIESPPRAPQLVGKSSTLNGGSFALSPRRAPAARRRCVSEFAGAAWANSATNAATDTLVQQPPKTPTLARRRLPLLALFIACVSLGAPFL
jgi:hypothetical protein